MYILFKKFLLCESMYNSYNCEDYINNNYENSDCYYNFFHLFCQSSHNVSNSKDNYYFPEEHITKLEKSRKFQNSNNLSCFLKNRNLFHHYGALRKIGVKHVSDLSFVTTNEFIKLGINHEERMILNIIVV